MEKDAYYWRQHKEIYLNEMDDLDSSVLQLIQQNPNGQEAQSLEYRVHRLVRESLQESHA